MTSALYKPFNCCLKEYHPIEDVEEVREIEMQTFSGKIHKVKHLDWMVSAVGGSCLIGGVGGALGGYMHNCSDCMIIAGIVAGIGFAILGTVLCCQFTQNKAQG